MPPLAKKRKTTFKFSRGDQPEEVTFNFGEREHYLKGFHKRKLERQEAAKKFAEQKAREERIRARAQLREQRRTDLERHVEEVNAALRNAANAIDGYGSESEGINGTAQDRDEDQQAEWGGIADPADVRREEEYIDEDKYATVTIEPVSITKDGFEAIGGPDEDDDLDGAEDDTDSEGSQEADNNGVKRDASGKRIWTKEKPKSTQPKKKKKKFRYETFSERKVQRTKEKSKRVARAISRREAREASKKPIKPL